MDSRRKNFFISLIKYSISLAIAGALFWWVYGDFNFKELFHRFTEVNLNFIWLSLGFGMISYITRAYQWALLFQPLGYGVSTFRSFVALMIGYFANLLVPRMGEVTRCGVLRRIENVEFTSSFGTVVAERTIDVICLFVVVLFGLAIEFNVLSEIISNVFGDKINMIFDNKIALIALALFFIGLLTLSFYLLKKYKHHIFRNAVFLKVRALIRNLMDGFLSVRKLERPVLFWFATLTIWLMYYLMTYVVFFSFEPTMHLGMKAGLIVLIVGGFGMATPVQGGVGAFHLFVSSVLLIYGVAESNGQFFALVLHTSQFLFMLVAGGISFFISLTLSKRNASNGERG